MNTRTALHRISPTLLILSLLTLPAGAVEEEQLEAIRALGRLNGIALHCRSLTDTQRIKRALVLHLPKRRQLGELFEYETNQSYMAFIEKQGQCPSPALLSRQVDEALEQLKAVYGAE